MKAPEAFRTISEVAEDLDLPQHVLRFWETRFTQIKPMKRGGGRRYYRPEDVDLLRGIRVLLYSEGFTIRGVQRVLKEKGVAYVAGAGQTGSATIPTGAPGAGPEASAWEEAETDGAEPPDDPNFTAPEESGRPDLDLRTDPGFAPLPDPVMTSRQDPRQEPRPERRQETRPETQPPPPATQPTATGLSQSDRRRIEFALADLLEAKRLLDGVR